MALNDEHQVGDDALMENLTQMLRQLELFVPLAQRLVANVQALIALLSATPR